MTAATAARRLVHRTARCRTWGELLAIGDRLGLDRELPWPVYLARFRRRHAELAHLATTAPYRARGGSMPRN